ncbi:hypothetical protein PQQ84_23415 [Paraburkholderia strydomiana]|uniref:hypothetical protein n=1 Tax=Paraburkholderia strydomiana TaxID=1245417 RepID=UPI0038B7D7DD
MFLTSDQNRLPVLAGMSGGVALWAVTEMWGGGDVLILQFSATKRDLPRVAMVELASTAAATLTQLDLDGQILRGAAVLSVDPQKESAHWKLDPVNEIHLGATEAFDDQHPIVSFARFTTAGGEEFSLPIGVADKHSCGKRIFPSATTRSSKSSRRKSTVDGAGTS